MMIDYKKQLTATELDTVAAIWLAGNLAGHPFIDPAYWQKQQAAVKQELAQTPLYVAFQDQTIVGFLGLQGTYIAGIFVQDGCRDQGIGSALLTAVQAKHAELTLTVYHRNIRAMAFYVQRGFHRQGSSVETATGEREDTLIWQATK